MIIIMSSSSSSGSYNRRIIARDFLVGVQQNHKQNRHHNGHVDHQSRDAEVGNGLARVDIGLEF